MAGHVGRKSRLHPSGFCDRLDNMNKDIKKKWVDALRSGEYKQGQGRLKNEKNEYCCLGVLCDLAVKEGVVQEKRVTEPFRAHPDYFFDKQDAFLPASVVEWAGLNSTGTLVRMGDGIFTVRVEYNEERTSLSALNDAKGLTFNEIADLIKEQL